MGSLLEELEGGRGVGGKGDVERAIDGPCVNTAETGVRTFVRYEAVGIVSRSAAGLEEGVVGRVGGTAKSRPCMRLVELACALAREDAVVALYRAAVAYDDPDPDG